MIGKFWTYAAMLVLGAGFAASTHAQTEPETQAAVTRYQQAVSQHAVLAGADQQWRMMYAASRAGIKCRLTSDLHRIGLVAGSSSASDNLSKAGVLTFEVSTAITKTIEAQIEASDCETLKASPAIGQALAGGELTRDSYLLVWNIFLEDVSPHAFGCRYWTMPEIAAGQAVFAAGAERLKQRPDYAQREELAKRHAANLISACVNTETADRRFMDDGMLFNAELVLAEVLKNPTVTQ